MTTKTMTARQKVEAYAECRACLEHDPVYGREKLPEMWARLDSQESEAKAFDAMARLFGGPDELLDGVREEMRIDPDRSKARAKLELTLKTAEFMAAYANWMSPAQTTIPDSRVWEEKV